MQQELGSGFSSSIPIPAVSAAPVRVRPTQIQILIWAAILSLSLGISLYNFNGYQLGTLTDDACYVILARSLMSSPHYGMINVPGQPGPGKYPFVFPMMLAPILWLFPGRPDLLPVPTLLATLANTALLFWGWKWIGRGRSYWWGVGLAGLYALAPLTIDNTHMAMSEPVFTTFCLTSILLAEQYASGRVVRGWSLWMALSLVCMGYSRSIGLVMILAVLAYILVKTGRRAWKDVLRTGAFAAGILALVVAFTPVKPADLLPLEYFNDTSARILHILIPASLSQSTQASHLPAVQPATDLSTAQNRAPGFADLLRLLRYGLTQHLGSDIRLIVMPLGGGSRERAFFEQIGLPLAPSLIGYLISAMVLVGLLYFTFRSRFPLFSIFALVYFPLMFLWIWIGPRLLYPIQAQFYLGYITAMDGIILLTARLLSHFWEQLRAWKPDRSLLTRCFQPPASPSRLFLAGLVVILVVTGAYKSLLINDSTIHTGDLRLRDEWLQANALPGDILLSEMPETDYFYSGLRTVDYPPSGQAADLIAQIKQENVTLILVAPQVKWQQVYSPQYSDLTNELLPTLEEMAAQGKLKEIYESKADWVRVYRVLPGALQP